MKLFYEYVHKYLRINIIRNDLVFIRTCKKEGLIPTFARVRLGNPYLRNTNVEFDCSQRILQGELKYKKRLLSRTYRHMKRLSSMLKDSVPNIIYNRLISIRDGIVLKQMHKIELTHGRKLANLRRMQTNAYSRCFPIQRSSITISSNDKSVMNEDHFVKNEINSITNLSKRPLTIDEHQALKHGLHHVYASGSFDHSRFVCNMEYFYARLITLQTDYRHYEQKDAKQQVVHKLSSEQLQAASQLRSISNSFQKKTESEMKVNNQAFQNISRTLKSLQSDQNIIITKPDKGRGVVVMDKEDYISRMETILNDESTFKRIDNDPTMISEDRLIRLLLTLKKDGFITNEEYNLARPVGSRAARLYGLPKLHKQNYPLRPVMSAIKTVGYGLGKMLTNRLSHLRQSPYIVKDSFDFLSKIKSSKNVDKVMVSFDVVSLFTNVPLTFTIDYILDQMYPRCTTSCLNLTRIKQCKECKRRIDFEALLRTATSETHFTFNNQMYVQHNGVAMGAPLAPVIADIFMAHLETSLMDQLMAQGVYEWYRYVDDTFVLVNSSADIINILSILNNFHSSIKFTHKEENDNKLEFLDVQVIRSFEQRRFETTIYRKPTFTGLTTNWNSYVPMQYKKASIVSMINRALNICSTYTTLAAEFDEIRRIGINNDYPLSFIDTMIGIRFSQYREKNNGKSELTTIGCNKKQIFVEIPFVSSSTLELKNKLLQLAGKFRPDLDVQFFSRPPTSVQALFQTKDPFVKHMQSDVVYCVKCIDCQHSYIGKTERQCYRRLLEHGAPKSAFVLQQRQQRRTTESDDFQNNNNSNVLELRRSSRLRNKPIVVEDDKNIILSSIKQHEKETGHHMDWTNFHVVCQDNHPYRLLIKESLMIKAYEPELNRTTHSVPLVIYPDGLPRALLPKPSQ